mgnify:CR=1 FL=1
MKKSGRAGRHSAYSGPHPAGKMETAVCISFPWTLRLRVDWAESCSIDQQVTERSWLESPRPGTAALPHRALADVARFLRERTRNEFLNFQ